MFKDKQNPQGKSDISQLLGLHFAFLKYTVSESQRNCWL